MQQRTKRPDRIAILVSTVSLVLAMLLSPVFAQTPDAEAPPVPPVESAPPEPAPTDPPAPVETEPSAPVETEPPAPVVTDPPVPEVTEPMATEPTDVATEPTDQATETAEPTETSEAKPSTPEPTKEIIEPDALTIAGPTSLTVAPGSFVDVVVQYTLGSDRQKTELSGNISSPAGVSLEDWNLGAIERGDLDQDPNDPNRDLKVRFDFTDSVTREGVVATTWRITAPKHIEQPVTVELSFSSNVHRTDGVNTGVSKPRLVTINATASTHAPTLHCDALAGDSVTNTWNCQLSTDHPGVDAVVKATVTEPEGWDLAINEVAVQDAPIAIATDATGAASFSVAAKYPIGCPDPAEVFASTLNVSVVYPSGETQSLSTDLALTFERPDSAISIESVQFQPVSSMSDLTSNGAMTLSFRNAPCGVASSITFGDLSLGETVVEGTTFSLLAAQAPEGVTVTMQDNRLVVIVDERITTETDGLITLTVSMELPHLVEPGDYTIKLMTELITEGSE